MHWESWIMESVLEKAVMTSGKNNQDIRTPLHIFHEIEKKAMMIFDDFRRFDLDPCDSIEKPNHLGINSLNLLRGENGLKDKWNGMSIFVNPPFNNIMAWVIKMEQEFIKNNKLKHVVFLVPSRTETRWYNTMLKSKYLHSIFFYPKRIKFDNFDNPFVIGITFMFFHRNGGKKTIVF